MNWIPDEVKALHVIRSRRWLGHIFVRDIDFLQNTDLPNLQSVANAIDAARAMQYLEENGNGVYTITSRGLAELAKYDKALFDCSKIKEYIQAYKAFVSAEEKTLS